MGCRLLLAHPASASELAKLDKCAVAVDDAEIEIIIFNCIVLEI
jgi:hypothetical protein